jgi:secretion/DNA translocation related CpaE-like protein
MSQKPCTGLDILGSSTGSAGVLADGRLAEKSRHMTSATALLITRDDTLLEDVLRLAAAAGVVLDVAHDTASAMRGWSAAAVVLVGADQAARVAEQGPVRREQVHVVGRSPLDDRLFRAALGAGAADVVELPSAEAWLVELLTDITDGGVKKAVTIGVIGGSGGAGATTLACALASVVAARGPALLMDLDPIGPGADRVVGLEGVDGVRWETLVASTGRFGSRSLRDALPQRGALAVLTWSAAAGGALREASVREVLGAAQRGNDVVVVDLPRHCDEVAMGVVARCDHVVLVSGLTLPAVAASVRVVAQLQESAPSLHVVVRGGASGLSAEQVVEALRLPLLVQMRDQKRLVEHIDLGLGPVHSRRGPLSRAARTVCARLVPGSAPAA